MKNPLFRSPLVVIALVCATGGICSAQSANASPQALRPAPATKASPQPIRQPIRLAQLDEFDMGLPMEDDVALTPRERLDLTLLCADLCKGRYDGNLAQQALAYARCMAKCLKGYKDLGFYETEESSSELDSAVLEDDNVLILEVD